MNPKSLTTEPEPNYQVERTEPYSPWWVRFPQLLRSTSGKIANAESGYWAVYWCDSFAHCRVAWSKSYSVCGNILAERRCRMQPETLDKPVSQITCKR